MPSRELLDILFQFQASALDNTDEALNDADAKKKRKKIASLSWRRTTSVATKNRSSKKGTAINGKSKSIHS